MIDRFARPFGAEGGSIINIGSTASVAAYPTLSIYVASKSAVNGLTRVLSKELGPRKIRVNALSPGGTETEGAHAAGVMGAEAKKQIIASTPLGRVSQPRTSRGWPYYLLRMMRDGSREKSSTRTAATGKQRGLRPKGFHGNF